MGWRTILTLIGLVAGLGLVLWFTSEKPPAEESAEVSALDGRSVPQCRLVRWQFRNQAAFELLRGDDGIFRLSEPIADRAAVGYVQQIFAAWGSANLLATEFADDEAGRAETGLDDPVLTFAVEWPDGHRIDYDVGAPGPLGTDRFLRRDGVIWRGGNGLYESMRVNLSDLRDRQVFLHREVVCRELAVESNTASGKRERIALERVEGNWRLRSPVDGRAEPAAAVRFVTAVLSLRVDSFMSSLVRRPERAPDVVVAVAGGYGTEELELWVDQGAAFGRLPGRTGWFQCDPRTFDAVFKNAVEHLRARALILIADIATDLAEIVVDPGQGRGERVHLLRESVADPWRLTEPVDYVTNPTRANELIQAVNNLRAVEFVDDRDVDDPELGLRSGRLMLSVRAFEEREALTLWLGAAVTRGDLELVYCCRADETGTVVLVPAPAVERLRRDWTDYCARDVVKIPVPIERLEISRPDGVGKRVYGRDAENGHWLEEGRSERLRELEEFVNDDLRDLAGRAVVDLRESAGFGAPDWHLKLCRSNGDELQLLRVWDRPDSPVVLQPRREDQVGFEVGPRVSRHLRELWK